MVNHSALAPACLRRSAQGVSPIIGTILVVAVTIVLGTVLYVLLTNALAPPPPAPPVVVFTSQGWSPDSKVYTASVSGSANVGNIDLGSISYKVEDVNGNLFFAGRSGESRATSGITVTVVYHDADSDSRISSTDTVTVTVDPPAAGAQAVSGGILRLIYRGDVLASHSI